jgi:hypothetical protein
VVAVALLIKYANHGKGKAPLTSKHKNNNNVMAKSWRRTPAKATGAGAGEPERLLYDKGQGQGTGKGKAARPGESDGKDGSDSQLRSRTLSLRQVVLPVSRQSVLLDDRRAWIC